MERESVPMERAKCGHREYADCIATVYSIWDDEPKTQCRRCCRRWLRITEERSNALTREDFERLCEE